MQPENPRVEIRPSALGRSVYARQPFREGEVVASGWGPRSPRRTRHTFQVGLDHHVLIENEVEIINHSCDPNCGVLLPLGATCLQVVARGPIAPGEELTIDYAMFEYAIEFMPDDCLCGSPLCRRRVTGYRDLPAARRREYGRFIAGYLPLLEAGLLEAAIGDEDLQIPIARVVGDRVPAQLG